MNLPSASSTKTAASRILVWDAPVRVFHWLLVLCFSVAYEPWEQVHVTAGYTLAGLVVFRLLWGVVGSYHAQFRHFLRGPAAVLGYLRSLWRREPQHYTGHNPAGAVAILLLLGLGAALSVSGWAMDVERGGEAVEELHEVLANLMLGVVLVHLAGVISGSLLHHENLVRAMVTGYKSGAAAEAIAGSRRWVAVLLLVAVLVFWWLQWQGGSAFVEELHHTGIE